MEGATDAGIEVFIDDVVVGNVQLVKAPATRWSALDHEESMIAAEKRGCANDRDPS